MSNYILSCCSTCDMSLAWHEQRDVACVFFNYALAGVPYKDDYGRTHTPAELYARMLAGEEATTSQVNVGEYLDAWAPFLEQGLDVLHVTISSGISNTYSSACTARDMLAERYPGRTVVVVDSLTASSGTGLLVDRMADLRDEGMGIHELAAWAEAHKLEVQGWFFSTDLTFFIRGGRISKAAGLVGGLLQICPVMYIEPDGTLAVREKIRSKPRAAARVIDLMAGLAQGGEAYADKVFISHSECPEDALALGERVQERFANARDNVRYFPIGATIGTHTGPGTVTLFYWGQSRA